MSQLQLTYHPVQDRLALQLISESEPVTIWLTRRLTIMMLGHIESVSLSDPIIKQQASHAQKQQILDFHKEAAQVGDKLKRNTNKWRDDQLVGIELLAMQLGRTKNNELKIHCRPNKTLTLPLNLELALLLKEMLVQCAAQAQWDIDLARVQPIGVTPDVEVHYKASIRV